MILKPIYILFIGILFAVLVGAGIAAFYEGPKEPEYPSILKIPRPESMNETVFNDLQNAQVKYDKEIVEYQVKQRVYNRNVSVISLFGAIISLVISLTLFNHIYLIADGMLLGGVFTLFYSIIRGFDTNSKFRFLVVTCGFIIALALGYIKFIKNHKVHS